MKVSKFITFFCFFLLIQAVSLKSQTNNLIVNGSFEDVGTDGKPTGWEYSTLSNVTWSTNTTVNNIPDGERVLDVLIPNTTNVLRGISQPLFNVESGETFLLSFSSCVYGLPSDQTRLFFYASVSFHDTRGATIVTLPQSNLEYEQNEWRLNEIEFTVPAEAVQMGIMICMHLGVDVYIDNVQLIKTSEGVITGIPATHAMLQAQLSVRVENGNLVVSGAPSGSRIDVYNLFGERLQSVVAAQGETVLSGLPKNQVLIVRNGNKAAKAAL